MYAFICLALVSQIVLWNFMELRNIKSKDENDQVNTSSPVSAEVMQPPRDDDASNDTDAIPTPRSKRQKKDSSSLKSVPLCRFCKQIFSSPQALGGHMNRHRGEREKEEFQKAEILVHTKGPNFALGYPSGGAGPSYYQSESSYGNHYQGGGGTQMANASMMGNMGAGGLQRQTVYQNSNQQQIVGVSQMNPNYGSTQQQTAQYQSQSQHGGSNVNYNQSDNTLRPPQIQGGVPQTSYTPRANSGQYQVQGTGSLRDVRQYAMPHGGSSTGVAHHQSNTSFSTSHNLSQAAGGANTATFDTIASLGIPARSISTNDVLRQSTANQAVAQFVDQSGNIIMPGPSSGLYMTGLRPLNASHFHDNVQASTFDQGSLQDRYTSQVSYVGTSVHSSIQVQSEQFNNAAALGMENRYDAPGVGMLDFEDEHEEDEFGNGGADLSTILVAKTKHGSGSNSTGRFADARSHI